MKWKIAGLFTCIVTVIIFFYNFIKYTVYFISDYNYISGHIEIKPIIYLVLGNYLRWFNCTTIITYMLVLLFSFIIGYLCAGPIIKFTNYTANGIKSAAEENYYNYSRNGIFRELYNKINESFKILQHANEKHKAENNAKEKQLESALDELKEYAALSKAYSEILTKTKIIPSNVKEKEYIEIIFKNCIKAENLTTEIQFILKSHDN